MPDFCTCGAELPPDARFCHKCAKPQRDEPFIAEVEPAPPLPVPLPPPVAGSIDFRNALAVRVGFMTALLASLFNVLLFIACPLWLGAAGFFGVHLYQRRTGATLAVRDGARLGWITGLFSFGIIAVLFALIVVSQVQSGDYLKQAKDNPFFHMTPEQVQEIFSNPIYLVSGALLWLVILFVVFTMIPVAGGALGAKMLGKGRPEAIR